MSQAEQGLFVVCDGMGGAPAGEVASEMAIQAIARRLTGTDKFVYVVKADSTPVSQVQKYLAMLQQSHAPVFGVVLNQVDLRKARKYGYSHSQTFYNYDFAPR